MSKLDDARSTAKQMVAVLTGPVADRAKEAPGWRFGEWDDGEIAWVLSTLADETAPDDWSEFGCWVEGCQEPVVQAIVTTDLSTGDKHRECRCAGHAIRLAALAPVEGDLGEAVEAVAEFAEGVDFEAQHPALVQVFPLLMDHIRTVLAALRLIQEPEVRCCVGCPAFWYFEANHPQGEQQRAIAECKEKTRVGKQPEPDPELAKELRAIADLLKERETDGRAA